MDNGVPLDVLKIVERLEGGGVPPDQAKVQATVLADAISAQRRWIDDRFLPRGELSDALLPIGAGIEKIDAKVDRLATEARATTERLEMKIDKSASDVKTEIMRWTVSVWFLQFGFFTALLFKLTG